MTLIEWWAALGAVVSACVLARNLFLVLAPKPQGRSKKAVEARAEAAAKEDARVAACAVSGALLVALSAAAIWAA